MIRNLINRLLHRMASGMPGGWSVRPWLHRRRGVSIGTRVWISRGVYIDELHPEVVSIGDNCSIGLRTSIITHLYWGPRKGKDAAGPVVIGNDTFVGPHCVILPNVHIGEGSVIMGGTVVTRNVPPRTLWGPVPAGPLGDVTIPLTPDHTYDQFVHGLKLRRRKTLDGGARTAL